MVCIIINLAHNFIVLSYMRLTISTRLVKSKVGLASILYCSTTTGFEGIYIPLPVIVILVPPPKLPVRGSTESTPVQ